MEAFLIDKNNFTDSYDLPQNYSPKKFFIGNQISVFYLLLIKSLGGRFVGPNNIIPIVFL